ncbi:laminin subunit alpha-3-like [Sander lucioperca]|uniref:laminin subunit alpha-3-like n=1 Tax=Sander lucioperca TaxID=283035 RepID=UPI0016536F98|nr:laminin subunit alpha-3-like [Sander lucioperca]
MQWNIPLICSIVLLFLLCFAPFCNSTEKSSEFRHDGHSQIHEKTHSTKKFCDPSFNNQTVGAITQNCQFDASGDRCECCKEGYYGNAANRTCRACPCPFTWNSFALACLDISSGGVECLCKRGYRGATCERCAFGYYGNPMVHGGSCKPCNCKDGLNICDSLTGECITSGNSSCGAHCHECDSSTVSLLVDLEKMDDALAWLQQQQLQNVSNGPGLLSRLEANISETKSLVGSYSTAVRHLDPTVEELEVDVDVGRDDLSQLTDKRLRTVSDLEKVLQNVNGRKLKAEDLLSEAEALLTATQDLIKQHTGVKPGESVTVTENNKARMMEEAQGIVQEMRARGCTAQRDRAGREQEDTHKLLDIIRNNMADPLETNQTGDSLMASDSSLSEVAELLTDAGDRVDRTRGLNLKARTALQHLEVT